jgi:hypothetical protein
MSGELDFPKQQYQSTVVFQNNSTNLPETWCNILQDLNLIIQFCLKFFPCDAAMPLFCQLRHCVQISQNQIAEVGILF